MSSEHFSLRIPKGTKEKLEELAKATGRTKAFLAIEAVPSVLDMPSSAKKSCGSDVRHLMVKKEESHVNRHQAQAVHQLQALQDRDRRPSLLHRGGQGGRAGQRLGHGALRRHHRDGGRHRRPPPPGRGGRLPSARRL